MLACYNICDAKTTFFVLILTSFDNYRKSTELNEFNKKQKLNDITFPKLVYRITVVFLLLNEIAKTEFQEFDKLYPIEYYIGPKWVPRYVLQNIEIRIELAILKTDNFNKIIKCFIEDEKVMLKLAIKLFTDGQMTYITIITISGPLFMCLREFRKN
ncbi:1830_t:CDS:2 [Funneliformis mosseae]|uniref:1830_t:CDS:1 n=1 Tax=Funneliformis mosseae TaxID=27381 RepID=A0A9N9FTQ6_FUNMO|nr:1830_t:CDS:2 [Funneliformis mosseae]